MSAPRAGVLGLGKAGGSLSASLLTHGVPLVAAMSRDAGRRERFRRRHPGGPSPVARLPRLLAELEERGAWVLFLATPDDALAGIARRLSRARWLPPVVAHLSGARGAEALEVLRGRTTPAAFHPLAALDGETSIPEGTLLAVDAGRAAVAQRLSSLATRLSLAPARIKPGEHARYHLGAVTSANLAVALLDEGIRHLVAAGVPEQLARVSLARLLESAARGAAARPLPESMTGPIARGDVSTVARHLEKLRDAREGSEALYRALSLRLVDIARLDERTKRRLRALLEG